MKFLTTLKRLPDGSYNASTESEPTGAVAVEAFSRDAALVKLRDEIRFRLEACPCTTGYGESDAIEIVVKE